MRLSVIFHLKTQLVEYRASTYLTVDRALAAAIVEIISNVNSYNPVFHLSLKKDNTKRVFILNSTNSMTQVLRTVLYTGLRQPNCRREDARPVDFHKTFRHALVHKAVDSGKSRVEQVLCKDSKLC